jgi:hypothetical protein
MDTNASPPAEAPNATSPATKPTKPAAKKTGAKKPAPKAKSSPAGKSRKPAPKKAAKPKAAKAPKKAAKPKAAAKNPGGRPMLYPDKTILRLPKGSLKIINAKAKAADKSQGEFLRGILSRTTGISA